jgi:hypothetical protein
MNGNGTGTAFTSFNLICVAVFSHRHSIAQKVLILADPVLLSFKSTEVNYCLSFHFF